MTNCASLWRISTGRSHSMSWAHPQKPPLMPWGNPVGNRAPDPDDQEVTFPRGGSGFPQKYHFNHLPLHNQMEVPLGQPPQPLTPAQPGADMGHLINTLTSGLHLGAPQINTFSGKATLGKTEVSFKQWYHKVQCIKDHYPEAVLRESIVRSLKGAVADMARYMGPTASVSNIMQKLTVIFGTVTSFDILMQNFYKVTQGNHEKVSSFTTRLEGTLNQIWLKCPGWIADCEVPWHLKDHLFHGVQKHIRDSIQSLYSNPMTTYSELMVEACKAESETEEAWDKVRAKSTVVTESVDGSTELSNQIGRLMAALSRAEQGNCPASTPNSSRHRGCGMGQMDRNTPTCPSSHNGQTDLAQTASAHSTSVGHSQSAASTGVPDSKAQGSTGGILGRKEPRSLQCFRCQGWDHMAWECATLTKSLNLAGGTEGMQPNPHQQQPTVGTQHSLPDPKPQLTILKGTQKKGWSEATPASFLNPDPVAQVWAIQMRSQWSWMGKKQPLS